MKVKLNYKEGVIYQDVPDEWFNRDRIYMQRKGYPTIGVVAEDLVTSLNKQHTFDSKGFKQIDGYTVKIYDEV